MVAEKGLRVEFSAAIEGVAPGLATADRLCRACVDLLAVDGAAISLIHAGATRGTFGSSGELSRTVDEFQFTFGEGPGLDSVAQGVPILVDDFQDPAEARWPAFAGAVLEAGIRAVYALPVSISTNRVGALDLYRSRPGPLGDSVLSGALLAAQIAALPLLDLMSADVDWAAIEAGQAWSQLDSLERVEVYQATGMVMGQLRTGPTEALVRLRAHAFTHSMTVSQVAWEILGRRLRMQPDPPLDPDPPHTPPRERGPV
jgi:hypothetical protein